MAYSGRYKPKNKNKYKGDHTLIIYRSMWERHCMKYFDESGDVLEWSSEEVVIPYYYEVDKKIHRYYMDFKVKWKNGTTSLIEVKPEKETVPPSGNKRTKRYITEAYTYVKNQNKWEAASEYCENRKWKFEIWTENTLRKMGLLPKKMPGKLKPMKKMKPYSRKKTK